MKCLVTGATGFIGTALCRALLANGHEVTPWSLQGGSVTPDLPSTGVDLNLDISQAPLEGIDVVFHLAGIAHQNAREEEYDRTNCAAALRLAQLASDAGVAHFIFLSSVKAMGKGENDEPRSEEHVRVPNDAYGLSKWRAESALRKEYGGGNMKLSIVRPALVYGAAAKGNLQRLAQAVRRGMPRPPEGGQRSMIALGDLVMLLLTAAAEPPRATRTWIATAEAYSTREIYDLLREALGRSSGRDWLPGWGWRAASSVLDVAARSDDEGTYQKLFGAELYSNERALAESSWRPTCNLREMPDILLVR